MKASILATGCLLLAAAICGCGRAARDDAAPQTAANKPTAVPPAASDAQSSRDHEASMSRELSEAKAQLTELRDELEAAKREAAAAKQAAADATAQGRDAADENARLRARLAQVAPDPAGGAKAGGAKRRAGDGSIPDEVRRTFADAVALREEQIKQVAQAIRSTPSKDEARDLAQKLAAFRSTPLEVPPLMPTDLSLDQVGQWKIDDYLRVDEVVDAATIIVTPVIWRPDPDAAPGDPNSMREVEANPLAIAGIPTRGYVTGAKITKLPGLFWVQATERHGNLTIFRVTSYDAMKFRDAFNRLAAERAAREKQKPRPH